MAGGRAGDAGRLRGDDKGAFLVFEAVLVAIFIFTAILFVTSIQRPTMDLEERDLNLAVIAADTLHVLEKRAPLNSTAYDNRLEEIVDLAMRGEGTDGHALIKEVLPQQTRYVLRLNNGVQPLHLLPTGSGLEVEPRGARAAETFIMPNWTVHESNVTTIPENATVYPGQYITQASHPVVWDWLDGEVQPRCTKAPDGSRVRPDGLQWNLTWQETPNEVPLDIPYGVWAGFRNAPFCTQDHSFIRVALPPGNVEAQRPAYGVQLVVWRGA